MFAVYITHELMSLHFGFTLGDKRMVNLMNVGFFVAGILCVLNEAGIDYFYYI